MEDTVITVSAPKSAPQLISDTTILASLIHPMPVASFMKDVFGKKCAHFKASNAKRIEGLVGDFMHDGDVHQLCEETPSDEIHCWLRIMESGKEVIESVKVTEAKDAMTLHKAGASLYFRAPDALANAFIPAISEALGMSFASYYDAAQKEPRGEVETFVSKKGHITRWHWDFMENFTVQISGKKRWRLCKSKVAAPVRGATPHYQVGSDVVEQQVKLHRLADPDFEFSPSAEAFRGCFEVELQPGDTFYFPAGMWHEVTATEDSLSINFSLVTQTWADLASAAVKHSLITDGRWRRMITLPLALPQVQTAGKKRKHSEMSGASSTPSLPTYLLAAALPEFHTEMSLMLEDMKARVTALIPGMFVTPAMCVSKRFGGVPGSRELPTSESALFNPEELTSKYGFDTWFHKDQLVLTVLPSKKESAIVAFPKSYSINPLALLHWSTDVGLEGHEDPALLDEPAAVDAESISETSDDDDAHSHGAHSSDENEDDEDRTSEPPPRPEGYMSAVVHVNFGFEDISSSSRTVVQFPNECRDFVSLLKRGVLPSDELKLKKTNKASTTLQSSILHALAFAGLLVVA